MLSMRNGLSLHPMCLPENEEVMHAPHPSQIGVHNLNNSSTSFDHINISNSTNMIPHTLHSSFNLANRSGSSTTRPFLSDRLEKELHAHLPTNISNGIRVIPPPFGVDSAWHGARFISNLSSFPGAWCMTKKQFKRKLRSKQLGPMFFKQLG